MAKWLASIGLVIVTGCAQFSSKTELGYFDSALNDKNRAPQSLEIPNRGSEIQIDELHLRTQADLYYSYGEAYSNEGQTEKAIEAFKSVLIYDPDSVQVRLRLAGEYVKMGLLSEALESTQEALKKNPDQIDGLTLMGGLYSTMKEYARAIEVYERVLDIQPNHKEVPIYLGAVYSEMKNYPKALESFDRLSENPEFDAPHLVPYLKGRVLVDQNTSSSKAFAKISFLKALEIKPDHLDSVLSLYYLVRTQEEAKKLKGDESIAILQNFVTENGPDTKTSEILASRFIEQENYDKALFHLTYLSAQNPDNLSVRVRKALIHIELKAFTEAIPELKEILVLAPDSDRIRFYLAAVYEEMKNYKDALFHYNQVIPQSQHFAEATINGAFIYRDHLGDIEASLKLVSQALQKRKDLPQLYSLQASLLENSGNYPEALKVIEASIQKFPGNVQMQFLLGTLYDRTDQKDKTVEVMRSIIKQEPEHVQALNYLAYTLAEEGKELVEAKSLAEKAVSLSPKDGFILDTLGWIHFKKGDYKLAMRWLEKAHSFAPKESIIAEHLGDTYFRLKLVDRARDLYLKAIENESRQQNIDKIQAKIFAIDNQEQIQTEEARSPASMKAESP